jgi:poly-gamma-glutamate capsule biosynthesis protein CapA/YwtB (metallophosphatase superfamily)
VSAVSSRGDSISLFLAGDVMTGRGVDQILPHPGDDRLYEDYVKSAREYVRLAEQANGPIRKPVPFASLWGAALTELDRRKPDARIVNLETAITGSMAPEPKGINYKMSPANVPVLNAAGIDCCNLANNHLLDWGRKGLVETLSTLDAAGIQHAGAGLDASAAMAPAVLEMQAGARVLVFGFASACSGVPREWAAASGSPGINLIPLTRDSAERLAEAVRALRRPRDVVIASIHWGPNWGYEISEAQARFAHRLIDAGAADLIHGHSSHHFKGMEVYRGKLILYGCGDFIDDYEGISGYEDFRDELVLMYFSQIRVSDGALIALEMVPLEIRNMRLNHAGPADTGWVLNRLNREGARLGTRMGLTAEGTLRLEGCHCGP